MARDAEATEGLLGNQWKECENRLKLIAAAQAP